MSRPATATATADPATDSTAAIERAIDLAAPPERVWRALTDPAELARWFPDTAELELAAGGEGAFTWERYGRFAVEVVEVAPPRRFAWRWSREADTAVGVGQSTLVEWTLVPRDDGGTRLEVRESGFVDPEHRRGNVEGWSSELGELVAYLATVA